MDRIYFGIRMSAAILPFKELKRLQIELLPFEDPVSTLLRSVPDDGPQGRGYNHEGTVKRSSNSREFERRLMLQRDDLMKKSRRVRNPAALISVVPKLTFRLSLREPRDRSYADRQCLRNRHARERRI